MIVILLYCYTVALLTTNTDAAHTSKIFIL